MLEMTVHEKACRGCRMCIDVCPTDCFSFDEETQKAVVETVENCIACLSCSTLCPASAIEHAGHHLVANFYRNIDFSRRMEKFL